MVPEGLNAEYPREWEADVVLRDGALAHVRPIAPTDAHAVQNFHRQQSADSIYLRFFTYKPELSDAELRRFTHVDYRNRMAFVATVEGHIIGIGRYDRLEEPTTAEVAFNIADTHQGRGIGSILLEHLAAVARHHGIRAFTAELLSANHRMLTVFTEAGYQVKKQHWDEGTIRASFVIDPTEQSRSVMEAREHRADSRSLQQLMRPEVLALISATRRVAWKPHGPPEDDASHSREHMAAHRVEVLVEHLRTGGFDGPWYHVDPHTPRAFPSVPALPRMPDLALIAVPHHQLQAAVEECAEAGVPGAIIFMGGFADRSSTGLQSQSELVRLARAGGMRLLGPASAGIINTDPSHRVHASVLPPVRSGRLGVFCQSAAMTAAVHATLADRGVGISAALSAGNRVDVSGADALQFWEEDQGTLACALYLESIGNPRKFSRLARRLSRTKPVIVAKSDALGFHLPPAHPGRTTQVPPGVLDAILRQAGVIRVTDSEQLADVSQLLIANTLPQSSRVQIVSNSHALARILADGLSAAGLELDAIAVETSAVASPDSTEGAALAARIRGVLAAKGPSEVGSLVVLVHRSREGQLPLFVSHLIAAAAGAPLLLVISGTQPCTGSRLVRAQGGAVVPVFTNLAAAIRALAALTHYCQWKQESVGHYEQPIGVDLGAARRRIDQWVDSLVEDEERTLSPEHTRELLGYFGVALLPSIPVEGPAEALEAAEQLGWPVALKSRDRHLRNRLDLGAVRLNIADPEALLAGVVDMRERLRELGFTASSQGLEVQSMAPLGPACIVQGREDPLLGPIISFALSGEGAELFDDWGHRAPPLTDVDLAQLVRQPRSAKKLDGSWGTPTANMAGVEDVVSRCALLKEELAAVSWLELNPVLASPETATVLNATVMIANPQQRIDSALRVLPPWDRQERCPNAGGI